MTRNDATGACKAYDVILVSGGTLYTYPCGTPLSEGEKACPHHVRMGKLRDEMNAGLAEAAAEARAAGKTEMPVVLFGKLLTENLTRLHEPAAYLDPPLGCGTLTTPPEARRPRPWAVKGAEMRDTRVNAGLSMGDVARRLSCSVVEVSDMERGYVEPLVEWIWNGLTMPGVPARYEPRWRTGTQLTAVRS